MRGITKLLLLCIFFTASITCRKETCVIVDKHTYTITDINTIDTQGDIFLISYFERNTKSKYYQKKVLELNYWTKFQDFVNNDLVILGSSIWCKNNTNEVLRVTFKTTTKEYTIELSGNSYLTTLIKDEFPKNAKLEIIKVEYL
jgi:hypothetical protein